MKTLNFLSDFWQKAKIAVDDICTELPKVASEDILKPLGTSGKMWTIQYKDLTYRNNNGELLNSWSPKDILRRHKGESKNLILLADKVRAVFEKSPDKVAEFLQSTAEKGYFVIKGSFAGYERTTIRLTINEVAGLKIYIQENV